MFAIYISFVNLSYDFQEGSTSKRPYCKFIWSIKMYQQVITHKMG